MFYLLKTAVIAIVFGLIVAGILWVFGNLFGFDVDFWYSARWLAVGGFVFDIVLDLVIAIVTDTDDNPRISRTPWN